jgi:hypothetical protein
MLVGTLARATSDTLWLRLGGPDTLRKVGGMGLGVGLVLGAVRPYEHWHRLAQ